MARTLRSLTFLALTALMAAANAHSALAGSDTMTVTAPTPASLDQLDMAKRRIAWIQADTGYYYSGAWGARHRVADVAAQKAIIERVTAELHLDANGRMPASN